MESASKPASVLRAQWSKLFAPDQRTLVGSGDPVEKIGGVTWIGVGLVESVREQRPRQCSLLRVRPLRKSRQLRRVLRVESDVQAGGLSRCHEKNIARNSTKRVPRRSLASIGDGRRAAGDLSLRLTEGRTASGHGLH